MLQPGFLQSCASDELTKYDLLVCTITSCTVVFCQVGVYVYRRLACFRRDGHQTRCQCYPACGTWIDKFSKQKIDIEFNLQRSHLPRYVVHFSADILTKA